MIFTVTFETNMKNNGAMKCVMNLDGKKGPKMSKIELTDEQKGLLPLILRSPDVGDGWRLVSKTLWPHVKRWAVGDLVETEEIEPTDKHVGRVRLTERGEAVALYM